MSMQPYDIKTYGRLRRWDSSSGVSEEILNTHVKLTNVVSSKGPAPYKEFRPHGFLKITMHKSTGWAQYRVINPSYSLNWAGSPYDYSAQMNFDPLGGSLIAAAQTEAYNQALNRVNDKVRGNLDLSIDLLQGSKTLRIAKDVSTVVRSLLKARNPVNIIKGIGDARLTWVYGIKPTLQSIYDAVEFTSRHYNNEFAFSKARGKGGGKYSSGYDTGHQWPDYTYKNWWEAVYSCRTEIGMVLRIPDTPQTQLARLTSLNPVSMAWELIPFSFVVDWFVNIGGYLRDLETAVAYNSYFVRGYRTDTSLAQYYLYSERKYHPNNERYDGEWGIKMIRKTKNRTVLSSYPMPSRPIFNANLGSGRLLNGAALLTLALGRGSKGISSSGGGSAYQRGVRGFSG